MTYSLINIQKVADDIKTITIQWATNIAMAGFEIMKSELQNQVFVSVADLSDFVKKSTELLMKARATEPMLFNGLKYCLNVLDENQSQNLSVLKEKLIHSFDEFIGILDQEDIRRAEIWGDLIQNNFNVLTHCHSGSAIDVLTTSWNKWTKFHAYNTETRPLFQWRKTSKDLVKAGIPTTMIPDSAATFFVDNLYDSHVDIDVVIIGCDAIKLNGDVMNKVGSFGIWLAAWHSNIPVYIAWSLLKVDTTGKVKIEKRDGKEVWPDAPEELEIINYAFDLVPAKFITGIITEFGIIKPDEIQDAIKKHYPWMIK